MPACPLVPGVVHAQGPPLAISGSTERASLAMAATSLLTHARTSNPPHSPSNSQYRSRADLGAEGVPQPRVVELYQKASSVAVVAAPQPKGGLAFATSRDRARSRLNLELGMGSDGSKCARRLWRRSRAVCWLVFYTTYHGAYDLVCCGTHVTFMCAP